MVLSSGRGLSLEGLRIIRVPITLFKGSSIGSSDISDRYFLSGFLLVQDDHHLSSSISLTEGAGGG